MTRPRIEDSDRIAIQHLTKCFSAAVWKKSVFTLTYANRVEPSPDYEGSDDKYFTEKRTEFTSLIQEILVNAEVPKGVVKEIPVIPTGYWKSVERIPNPWKLPDCRDWFNVFWLKCALRMEESACIALFKSQGSRLRHEEPSESERVGTAIERPIYVPSNWSKLIPNQFSIQTPNLRAILCSITGTLVGAGVGASVGVVAGPFGIAALGAAGAATGAAIGGVVATALADKQDK